MEHIIFWLIVIGLLLLIVLGMAIGVMFGRKPIAGSCGGISALGLRKTSKCEFCGNDPTQCKNKK
ncbi:(Na+)-NQR maturation NqrM [Thorsellia kenyensis]|uniref:(Na+)-NQR maturation NqrM n=1 Tax=Thorsellia kenyensis TaxID=1549888 RepID=A0ABV6CC17_9GAMM